MSLNDETIIEILHGSPEKEREIEGGARVMGKATKLGRVEGPLILGCLSLEGFVMQRRLSLKI